MWRRAGARLAPAIHYTGLLGQPVLHRAPGTPNRKTGRRRPTEEHYFRRSRQNGWLGTRVRESQMTCACVRLTTSTEVVHRNHRDRRAASWQLRRTPKGEQTNLIAKRACAEPDAHFVEILIKGIKAQARQMSTPATSNQMNENPTRHPKTENEEERQRKRKRTRGAGEEPAPGWHRLSTTPAY